MDSGGFEPPDVRTSLAFKTSALNQTLLTVHNGLVPVLAKYRLSTVSKTHL